MAILHFDSIGILNQLAYERGFAIEKCEIFYSRPTFCAYRHVYDEGALKTKKILIKFDDYPNNFAEMKRAMDTISSALDSCAPDSSRLSAAKEIIIRAGDYKPQE